MCRVVVLEGPECRQHRAYSVILVDTESCIRRCLRRQSILKQERVCMVLNQNSSACQLGLNPAGLTQWEKALEVCQKPQLKADCPFEGNAQLEESPCGLCCLTWGKTLLESQEFIMFLDRQENRRLSTNTQNTKGEQNSFCISSKRVEPDKYSRQKDSVVDAPMVV